MLRFLYSSIIVNEFVYILRSIQLPMYCIVMCEKYVIYFGYKVLQYVTLLCVMNVNKIYFSFLNAGT